MCKKNQMPESFNVKNPPNSLLYSYSALRGAVLSFIASAKECTHLQLVQQFGEFPLEDALTELFDRCQLDFAAGKYFVSPQDQWRPRPR